MRRHEIHLDLTAGGIHQAQIIERIALAAFRGKIAPCERVQLHASHVLLPWSSLVQIVQSTKQVLHPRLQLSIVPLKKWLTRVARTYISGAAIKLSGWPCP